MSEETPHEPPHIPHGFAVPVPLGQLFEGIKSQHDRQHMAHDAMMLRITNFLDELSVEQLLVMRHILNMDEESGPNNFIDGQICSILRLVHHVNPLTGQPDVPLD